MFCRSCGQENADGSRFCTVCGAPLDSAAGSDQPFGEEAAGDYAQGQADAAHDVRYGDVPEQTFDQGSPADPFSAGGASPSAGGGRSGPIVLVVILAIGAALCIAAAGALGLMFVFKLGPFAAPADVTTIEGVRDIEGEGYVSGLTDETGDALDETSWDDAVLVPLVEGLDADDAAHELQLLGLDVETREEHSSTVAEGLVITQSLAAGGDAEPGDTIILTVSLGPEMMTVTRYTFVHQCLTWEQARQWCEDNGGHLATISSADELNQVVAQLPAEGVVSCWLGGYRTGDGWAWVDGSDFGYTAWAAGEPNNEGGNENYVTLLKVDGSWSMYDVPNDVTVAYSSSKIGFVMETVEQVPVS